jgi:hypothetical protein
MHVIGWIIAGASTAVRLLTVADRTLRGAASAERESTLDRAAAGSRFRPTAGRLAHPAVLLRK